MTQPIGPYRNTLWPGETPAAPDERTPSPPARRETSDSADWEVHLLPRAAPASGASAPPLARVDASGPVRSAGPCASAGPNLVFDTSQDAYALSESARKPLQRLFDAFGFDVSRVSFQLAPSWRVVGRAAYTLGDSVTLNRDGWTGQTALSQLGLLAHEITHSVQYARLGYLHFLARYAVDYQRDGNYGVPPALSSIPVHSLDPVDPRFTLDQLAQRVAKEFGEAR